ncbi:IS5/IS1182 family transposase, partial [Lactobacillus helveticus]|nr:IS5/IS1182 family transposase [Lactobacillus helveticus]MDY1003019.1 IS5/IS1182 family transposase [Lactobacillus helveticus]MEB2874856.1 IS5/IS1182 family transposase [Lactobacillus helveticus]
SKDQFSLFKNKNREKKRPIKLKLRVELIVFQYLRVGYFPDTFKYVLMNVLGEKIGERNDKL